MKLRQSSYSGKTMDSTTKTVPDQNMGIRELLDRHSRGVPLGVNSRRGEYFDTEIVNYDDLTDMLEHKKELNRQKKELTNRIKEVQKAEKVEKSAKEQNLGASDSNSSPEEKQNSQKKVTTKA